MSKPIVIHFEKFALSDKYQFWSSKNVLKPEEITKVSEPYLFDCNECFHEIKLSLSDINRGRWCSYCSNKKLCDCDKCFEKSFASSDKSKYWSSKNIDDKNELINPRYIFKHSHTEYWFDCHCGHQFKNSLHRGCPYCANLEFCDCNKCYEKSFASHEKAKYWSSKNNLKPTQVTKGSDDKYLFDCECGHTFDCSLGNITRNNNWCPYCVNKTEQILYDKLITLYPSVQQQFKVEWCKKKKHLPFDFVIPERNIIIELDGPQHFIQISNWASPEETQKNDKYKTECANQNNYSVIRLLQEDVFYNTYNWSDELNQNIQKIISEGITQNIYMCKNNEYDADVL
jgi:very-short-patch-repair endonuclease